MMRTATLILTIAGTFCGGLSLVLLMAGWLGLVPYALIAAGVLLIGGAAAGMAAR
jgi:hypothetical protein